MNHSITIWLEKEMVRRDMIEDHEEQEEKRTPTSFLRGPIRWLSGVLCDRPAPNKDEMPGMPPGGSEGEEGDGEDGPVVAVSGVSEIPSSISAAPPFPMSCTARTLLSWKGTCFFYYARGALAEGNKKGERHSKVPVPKNKSKRSRRTVG